MSEIISSPIIPISDSAEVTDLWGVPAAFLADWTQGLTVETKWAVSLAKSASLIESRRSLINRPQHAITMPLVGLGIDDVALLQQSMARMTRAKVLAPLYCDQTRLDAAVYFRFQPTLDGNGPTPATNTGALVLDLTDYATIPWSATHDGIVVITGPDDLITTDIDPATFVLGVPTVLGEVTYTIPDDAIIVAQTSGDLATTGPYSRTFESSTADYTIAGTLDGSPSGAGVTTATVATDTGHTILAWAGVTRAALLAKGWVDGDNVARFRIWLIPSGPSTANIQLPEPITLICDTADRRFYPGGRVLIAQPRLDEARMTQYAVATISTVGDGYIALTSGGFEFGEGARVYPLIEGQPTLEVSANAITAQIERANITVVESIGPHQIPSTEADGDPVGFPTAGGVPVFDLMPDAESVTTGFSSEFLSDTSGIDETISLRGPHALRSGEFTVTTLDRAAAFAVIRFFDAMRGSLTSFIMPSPETTLRLDAISGTSIDVHAVGEEIDWERITHLVIQTIAGNVEARAITSVTRDGDIDTVVIASAFSYSAGQVQRITTGMRVVFAEDELREEWLTDEVARFAISYREVIESESAFGAPALGDGTEFDPPLPTRGVTTCEPEGDLCATAITEIGNVIEIAFIPDAAAYGFSINFEGNDTLQVGLGDGVESGYGTEGSWFWINSEPQPDYINVTCAIVDGVPLISFQFVAISGSSYFATATVTLDELLDGVTATATGTSPGGPWSIEFEAYIPTPP